MYSVRIQYKLGDILTTDLDRFEKLHQVNDKIKTLLDKDAVIEAIRMVKTNG